MLASAAAPSLWLSTDEVEVEAGGFAEIELGLDVGDEAELADVYAAGVTGLTAGWYTLSAVILDGTLAGGARHLLVIHPPRGHHLTAPGDYSFVMRAASSSGHVLQRTVALRVLAPGAEGRSRFLTYLPPLYGDDDFTNRFLSLFQSILDPIESAVDTTHLNLDPDVGPAATLGWLASWVGLRLDPCQDEASQRLLIRQAVELAKWRGTRRGLAAELRLRLGGRALVVENFDGLKLGQDGCLGVNTTLGERRDGCVCVTLVAENGSSRDTAAMASLVDELKPAYAGHVVRAAPWPVPQASSSRG